MSDNLNGRDADDAHADDAPPTPVVSDEVESAAAAAEDHAESTQGPEDSEDFDD